MGRLSWVMTGFSLSAFAFKPSKRILRFLPLLQAHCESDLVRGRALLREASHQRRRAGGAKPVPICAYIRRGEVREGRKGR